MSFMNTRKIIGIGVVGLGLVLAVLIPANARYHELIKTSETKAPSYRPLSEIVNTDEPRFYQVQKGDTLWTIARRHQVTVSSLAMANGIDDHDCIRVGQKLVIPDGKPRDIRHRVRAGETLWDIARKYNVSVNDLVKANRFRNPNLIVQGQQIVVPVRSLALPARTEWGPLMWPVRGAVTSPFGMRDGRMHKGIDIAADEGDVIRAARAGTVSFSGPAGTFGLLVILDHGDGLTTYYGHCSCLLVKEGETVQAGKPIARVGSTGRSQGPHLHFEVRWNGEPHDPAMVLPGGEKI